MDKPIYQRLRDSIYEEIMNQAPNTPIKSERELAEQYKVSRMTVRKAVRKLVDEGYLYRDKNKGTFVADGKLHKKRSSSMLFYTNSAKEENKILHFDVKDSVKEINDKLEIKLSDSFIKVIRLNLQADSPTSIDEIYIVRRLVFEEALNDINALLDFEDYIEKGAVNQTFKPVVVPIQYAKLLKIKLSTPIIMIESLISDNHGKVYAFIKTFTNPELVNIELTL